MLSHMLRASLSTISISFVNAATQSVNNSNGTSIAATIPAATQANDIIVVYVTCGNSNSATPPTVTTPSGYTLVNSQTASNTGAADAETATLYYKTAVAGDAGASLSVTCTTANFRSIVIQVFRTTRSASPTIATASVNSYGVVTASGTAANPPNQTVTSASASTLPIIVFAAYLNSATRSFTPTETGSTSSAINRRLFYKIYNTSPEDVTVASTTTNTTVVMQSFYMRIS